MVAARDAMRRYAGSMYEPQEQAPGGCREVFLLTRIAFQILLPALGALIAVLMLVLFLFYALATHPALALIPVGLFAAMLYGIYLFDKRRHRERREGVGDDDMFGGMR